MRIISFLLLLIFTSCGKQSELEWYLATHPKTQASDKKWNDWRGKTVVNDGDSFTYGYGVGDSRSYPTIFTAITGLPTNNKGMSGKTSTDIANRFLSEPQDFNKPHILWLGRNDNWSHDQIFTNIAALVAKIPNEQYLIIGLLSGNWDIEYLQDSTTLYGSGHNMHYWTTTYVDSVLNATYPGHFFSPQPYFLSLGALGAQDSLDIYHGIVPTRFRSDPLHLNQLGNAYLADTLSRRIIY